MYILICMKRSELKELVQEVLQEAPTLWGSPEGKWGLYDTPEGKKASRDISSDVAKFKTNFNKLLADSLKTYHKVIKLDTGDVGALDGEFDSTFQYELVSIIEEVLRKQKLYHAAGKIEQ